jgi:undecaprenyl-diphosphatase
VQAHAYPPARLPLAALATSAAALLVFGWLANQALRGQTAGFDTAVRQAIHAYAAPALTRAMKAFTLAGSALILIPVGCVAVWRLASAGRKRAAALLVISVLGGEVLDQLLKLLFHRPRPEPFFGFREPITYSFPSGHAITACSFYLVLAAILSRRIGSKSARAALWSFAAILAGAIGFSRVYLGVHYPSDVIAGYAAAAIWIVALERGYAAWRRRRMG